MASAAYICTNMRHQRGFVIYKDGLDYNATTVVWVRIDKTATCSLHGTNTSRLNEAPCQCIQLALLENARLLNPAILIKRKNKRKSASSRT